MHRKKRLIARLAIGAGVLLGLSLLLVVGLTIALQAEGDARRQRARREREDLVERSRKYLAELAARVQRLPVDPALLAEIESRYFEEQSRAPMHVWATDTRGGFLFGVPREAFDKLNAIYDADLAPALQRGLFLDRHAFLRRLVDASEEIGPRTFTPEPNEDDGAAWERLRRYAFDSERAFVVSTPLADGDGRALGSLYMKRRVLGEHDLTSQERTSRDALDVASTVAGLAAAFLWLMLPTWVYVDARGRAAGRAGLFAFLSAISGPIGLVVYLIARPETPGPLTCPGCSREVDSGAYCPHCGRDLSTAFCPTCRYPLKPDWAFCPACRTEIRPRAAEAAVAEAAASGPTGS